MKPPTATNNYRHGKSPMKVLVTGHLGFVGTHLVRALNARGDLVHGLDLKDGHDINGALMPRKVDRVYHLAAQVDAQTENARLDAWTNIFGTLRVLKYYGAKVVLASSSMVNYPDTPYAISKRAAEDYARMYGASVVRFCNLYGEGGHSVIDVFREAEELTIFGDGNQLRSYAPVEAAVAALLAAQSGELTVLPGEIMTVREAAAHFGNGKPITFAPARKHDPQNAIQIT